MADKIRPKDNPVTVANRPAALVVAEGAVAVGDTVEVILKVNGVQVEGAYLPYIVECSPTNAGGFVRVQAILHVQDHPAITP